MDSHMHNNFFPYLSIIFFGDWFMTPRQGKHQSLSDGQNSDLSEPVRCLVTDFADFVWRAFSLHLFTASRAVVNLSENAAGENSKNSQSSRPPILNQTWNYFFVIEE